MATVQNQLNTTKLKSLGSTRKYRSEKLRLSRKMEWNSQDLLRDLYLNPGTLDGSDNLVDNPLTKEPWVMAQQILQMK